MQDADSQAGSADCKPSLEEVAHHGAAWLRALRGQSTALASLVQAETRLAATSLLLMGFFAAMAAASLLGAWALAVAGLVLWLQALGVELSAILILASLVHLGAAMLTWRAAVGLSSHLLFDHTRAALGGATDDT